MWVGKYDSPVVDGVKMTFHGKTDIKDMVKNPKSCALKTGLAVELKL